MLQNVAKYIKTALYCALAFIAIELISIGIALSVYHAIDRQQAINEMQSLKYSVR